MTYNTSQDGWLRLWRRLLKKRIWTETNPTEKTIMMTLLLMSNYETTEAVWKAKTITLKPGSMIVTLADVAYMAKSEITIEDVADAIIKFYGPLDFLKQKIDSKNTLKRLIKIRNWKKK